MSAFQVTVQVNPTKSDYDFEELGGFFKKVSVNADNEKEAWKEASKFGIVTGITKLSDIKNPRKSWSEKLQDLSKDEAFMLNNRHAFACEWVVLMTASKYHRERVDGYQLKKVGKKYQISWNGNKCGYPLMDAQTAYSWMERLSLRKFMIEAEEWRIDVCSKAS